jgi:hypothetical protein
MHTTVIQKRFVSDCDKVSKKGEYTIVSATEDKPENAAALHTIPILKSGLLFDINRQKSNIGPCRMLGTAVSRGVILTLIA